MTEYLIRASSRDAIIAILTMASQGKTQPLVWTFEGKTVFRDSRLIEPWAETVPGTPVESTDPETGETVTTTPQVATGDWLCKVILDEPDGALELVSVLN